MLVCRGAQRSCTVLHCAHDGFLVETLQHICCFPPPPHVTSGEERHQTFHEERVESSKVALLRFDGMWFGVLRKSAGDVWPLEHAPADRGGGGAHGVSVLTNGGTSQGFVCCSGNGRTNVC